MRVYRAERRRRAGGAIGHLLLVVVLALGVFLMHAVGHPEGSGGGMHAASRGESSDAGMHAVGRAGDFDGGMHAVGHVGGSDGGMHAVGRAERFDGRMHAMGRAEAAAGMHTSVSPHPTAPAVAAPHGDSSDARHQPGAGMDMTTLCVAVLGAWLLARLFRAALGRRPEWLTLLLARLVRAVGPHAPPPRPPDLARLSVLRI
ncbi:hypothetical protein [Streptomyces sp. NPDC002825]|uniref:hypothetical protein n=1 Tax=Streptomyces sp. NPDC002825 TaxID=3154666 RepID=UPI00331A3457